MKIKALFVLVGIIVVGGIFQYAAEFVFNDSSSQDTLVRQSLLSLKNNKVFESRITESADDIKPSIIFSDLIYDYYLDSNKDRISIEHTNTNKNIRNDFDTLRIFVNNEGKILLKQPNCDRFEVIDKSGVMIDNGSFDVDPIQDVDVIPGIYVLKIYDCEQAGVLSVELLATKDEINNNRIKVNEIEIQLNDDKSKFKRLISLSDQEQGNVTKIAGAPIKVNILLNGISSKASLKLAGRTKQHLSWFPSVNINLQGGASFNGMSNFKLYRLESKSGLNDIVLMSILKDIGHIAPRVDLVKVIVDGELVGYYYMMEGESDSFFVNNKKVDGDIIGVDNDKLFVNYPIGGILDKKRYFNVKNKYHDNATKDEFLSGLTGRVDDDLLSDYVAFLSAYAASHGLGVDDLRFYYNPITFKYEPIPRDLNPGMILSNAPQTPILSNTGWIKGPPINTIYPGWAIPKDTYESNISLTDYHFVVSQYLAKQNSYILTLKYLKYYLENEVLLKRMRNRAFNIFKQIPELNTFYDEFDVYYGRLDQYRNEMQTVLSNIEIVMDEIESNGESDIYSIMPLLTNESISNTEVNTIYSIDTFINGMFYDKGLNTEHENYKTQSNERNNSCVDNILSFGGYKTNDDNSYYAIMIVRNSILSKTDHLTIYNRDDGSYMNPNIIRSFSVGNNTKASTCSSVDDVINNRFLNPERVTIIAYLINNNNYGFYRYYKKNMIFNIPPYFYFLKPNSYNSKSLEKIPNTNEIFLANNKYNYILEGKGDYKITSGIQVNDGGLLIKGDVDNPLVIGGSDGDVWNGLRVVCDNRKDVVFENVVFKEYGDFPYTHNNGKFLTGGISVYGCDITMSNVKFINSHAEDAINIINSNLVADNIQILNTESDGMDLDFSNAELSNFYVENIKGDGIDASFSHISLNSSTISNVKDKGISIGEYSFININNVLLRGSNIAIALKDQSKIKMNNVEFSDNNIGFAEYIKKPYFGIPYVIEKNNVSYNGNNSDNVWLGFNP